MREFVKRVRRWRRDRCTHCGHRFRWKRDARHSFGNAGEVYHDPCIGYVVMRRKAEERLAVLDLVAEVWEVDAPTVRELMANRARADGIDSANAWDLAWRVFYDLDNLRASRAKAESPPSPHTSEEKP